MNASDINLRDGLGTGGLIEKCYLAEESANICSPTFVVWIPSIMGGIDQSKTEQLGKKDLGKRNLNENNTEPGTGTVQMNGTIVAKNLTGYGHQLNGWIPHLKAKRMTMATGTAETYSGNLSGPTTPAGCGPHTHDTTGTHTYSGISMNTMEYKDINIWALTEVDYQNINNKVIKKGHVLYGCFPLGVQNEFIILAIDNVTPQLAGKVNRENADVTDTSVDGDKNPKNNGIE